MFQAVPPPIIRSSKLYTQHRVFVELLLLASCWFYLDILTMCGPMNIKFKNFVLKICCSNCCGYFNSVTGLTLNIASLGRQRCLSSWGPRRTPCFFFVISQLFDAVGYSNYVFWVSETIIQ